MCEQIEVNTIFVLVIKKVTGNMTVGLFSLGLCDLEGGTHNKGGTGVCLAGCQLPTQVAPFHSQIEYLTVHLPRMQRSSVLPQKQLREA